MSGGQNQEEELTLILHDLFQKIQEDRTSPNLFNKTSITLIPKPKIDSTIKGNQAAKDKYHVISPVSGT